LKFQVKELQRKEQLLEKEAQRRNQYILKVLAETAKLKDNMRQLSTKTGYDPVEGRVVRPERIVYATGRRQNKSVMNLPKNKPEEENDQLEVEFSKTCIKTNLDDSRKL